MGKLSFQSRTNGHLYIKLDYKLYKSFRVKVRSVDMLDTSRKQQQNYETNYLLYSFMYII